MIVENKSNGKRMECEGAPSILQKIRGLMFRRKIVPILFDFHTDGSHGIHSFFVCAPFYAIYISSSGRVVDKFRVAPNEAYRVNSSPARYLLEVDEGKGDWFSKGDEVKIHARMENH
jgi:uncharacterized membrane protein (UPF0127 family)